MESTIFEAVTLLAGLVTILAMLHCSDVYRTNARCRTIKKKRRTGWHVVVRRISMTVGILMSLLVCSSPWWNNPLPWLAAIIVIMLIGGIIELVGRVSKGPLLAESGGFLRRSGALCFLAAIAFAATFSIYEKVS